MKTRCYLVRGEIDVGSLYNHCFVSGWFESVRIKLDEGRPQLWFSVSEYLADQAESAFDKLKDYFESQGIHWSLELIHTDGPDHVEKLFLKPVEIVQLPLGYSIPGMPPRPPRERKAPPPPMLIDNSDVPLPSMVVTAVIIALCVVLACLSVSGFMKPAGEFIDQQNPPAVTGGV